MRSRRIPLSAKEIADWIRRAANRDSGKQKIAIRRLYSDRRYCIRRIANHQHRGIDYLTKKEKRKKKKRKTEFCGRYRSPVTRSGEFPDECNDETDWPASRVASLNRSVRHIHSCGRNVQPRTNKLSIARTKTVFHNLTRCSRLFPITSLRFNRQNRHRDSRMCIRARACTSSAPAFSHDNAPDSFPATSSPNFAENRENPDAAGEFNLPCRTTAGMEFNY